ncbi:TetR/AcrR family transcriptional regulator [Prosthecodimorpha staleyi]|uniref:TetR/AcrR family transcriptional regulator n=1 Tax=Prosthecodimorpha staleyi TaxID=2840188 RepID=A0A947GJX2_9HYPH|nr:TetR/AcrR family transcriptional regulator [Prosthecodimorpha staleyi]MBT9292639.1 TetR/AcrR family transcriptional regulator [Prosthecodimorpha staleyi]
MSRPRSFNETDVLEAATDCFWARGLEATSVRDLAGRMGINGPSLYNAFGDKRSLFMRALEHYAARSMRERIGRMERLPDPGSAIAAFFDELISGSLADPDRRGCLIVNSALEVAPHDPEIATLIAAYLAEIEAFFRRALVRAAARGDLPATVEPTDMARLLLGLVIAVRVMARTVSDRSRLDGMVRPILGLIQARPDIRTPA